MRSVFSLDGHDHELWLSRGPGGYRLHREGDDAGIDVALIDAPPRSPPPCGEGPGVGGVQLGERMQAARPPSGPPPRAFARGSGHLPHEGEGSAPCRLHFGSQSAILHVAVDGDDVHIHLDGLAYLLRYRDPVRLHGADAAGAAGSEARAPMPGTTLAVLVAEGQEVAAGEGLVVIESMKLETVIRAARAGTVKAVLAREGRNFERDEVLVALEEEG